MNKVDIKKYNDSRDIAMHDAKLEILDVLEDKKLSVKEIVCILESIKLTVMYEVNHKTLCNIDDAILESK